MKVRNGFVSNSSSSSFLVWFPEVPQSAEELRKLLFGDLTEWESWDDPIPTDVLAEWIWMDMQKQRDRQPYSDETIRRELENNAYWIVSERREKKRGRRWLDYGTPEYKKNQEEQHTEIERELDVMVKDCKKNEGTLFLFHYGDNDGEVEATLEHQGVFEKLVYIQVSHH